MPAAITHYLHGLRVAAHLQPNDPPTLASRAAFLWGLQGPDFLFTHRFFPWQKGESLAGYGERMHQDKPSALLDALYQHGQKDLVSMAYACGFCCHYALDSVCHPFVRYGAEMLQQQMDPSSEESCHNVIESALDGIILRQQTQKLPTELPLKRLIPQDEEAQAAIVTLYEAILDQLYHKQAAGPLLQQAVKDCRTAFGWMTDRTGLKKQLAEWIEKKKHLPPVLSGHLRGLLENDDYDYANINHAEWTAPSTDGQEIIHTESFFDLFQQAEQAALQLIQGLKEGQPAAALTQDRPF